MDDFSAGTSKLSGGFPGIGEGGNRWVLPILQEVSVLEGFHQPTQM